MKTIVKLISLGFVMMSLASCDGMMTVPNGDGEIADETGYGLQTARKPIVVPIYSSLNEPIAVHLSLSGSRLKVNDTMQFKNSGRVTRTFTPVGFGLTIRSSDGKVVFEKNIDVGDSESYTFSAPGAYEITFVNMSMPDYFTIHNVIVDGQ